MIWQTWVRLAVTLVIAAGALLFLGAGLAWVVLMLGLGVVAVFDRRSRGSGGRR